VYEGWQGASRAVIDGLSARCEGGVELRYLLLHTAYPVSFVSGPFHCRVSYPSAGADRRGATS
jgi:hypothetical protein